MHLPERLRDVFPAGLLGGRFWGQSAGPAPGFARSESPRRRVRRPCRPSLSQPWPHASSAGPYACGAAAVRRACRRHRGECPPRFSCAGRKAAGQGCDTHTAPGGWEPDGARSSGRLHRPPGLGLSCWGERGWEKGLGLAPWLPEPGSEPLARARGRRPSSFNLVTAEGGWAGVPKFSLSGPNPTRLVLRPVVGTVSLHFEEFLRDEGGESPLGHSCTRWSYDLWPS